MTGPGRPRAEVTRLSAREELRFQAWAHKNGITDVDHPDSHYDYRGYWRSVKGAAHPQGEHFPDTFKQHGHPTFSVESKYSTGPNDGGRWEGETFIPPTRTRSYPGNVAAGPRPQTLSHEQLSQRIRELDEEARRQNWSPRTRALGFALAIGRALNVGQLLKDVGHELTPTAIRERKEKLDAFNRMPVRDVTPEQLAELGHAIGGGVQRLAHNIAQRDPETLGTIGAIVAPEAASRIFAATPAGRLAALNRTRIAAAGERLAAERAIPEPQLPREGMDQPTFVRRGARAVESQNLMTDGSSLRLEGRSPAQLPDQYAILTAENPHGTPASSADNLRNMQRLKVALRMMGREGVPVRGSYMEGDQLLHENSLLVKGLQPEQAEHLGRSFGQSSVITHRGMHDLSTGVVQPFRRLQRGVSDAPFTELPGGERIRLHFGDDMPLREVAQQYRSRAGLTHEPLPPVEQVDVKRGRQMADAYAGLESAPNDPNVQAGYRQFMSEIDAQAAALKDAGYTWEFVDKDPYHSSAEMLHDLHANRHIKVLRTDVSNGHPLLTPEQNDTFRAVHDILGHGLGEHSFGPRGEERAFREHAGLLSPTAQRALATETRGQNSWFNFGPHGDLPVGQRPFAQQKAALWPESLLGDYSTMPAPERIGAGPAESESMARINRALTEPVAGPSQVPPGTTLGEAQPPLLSALRLPDGRIFTARTHYQALEDAKAAGAWSERGGGASEGFVRPSEPGKFLTRQEGEQIMDLEPTSFGLGSEDLLGGRSPISRRALNQTKEARARAVAEQQAERITGASVRGIDGNYYTGLNHGDAREAAAAAIRRNPALREKALRTGSVIERGTDGFQTSNGRYVTREEASQIARGAAQIKPSAYSRLIAEDLPVTSAWKEFVSGLREMNPFGGAPDVPPAVPNVITSPNIDAIMENLPPEFAEQLGNSRASFRDRVLEASKTLNSPDDFVASAVAGAVKRGWYKSSREAISDIFGADAPRFAKLTAALSPQDNVASNLSNSLSMWDAWNSTGRPLDLEAIRRLMQVTTTGAGQDAMRARLLNAYRALTAEDASAARLSGPKVHGFGSLLSSDVGMHTPLDTKMAQLANIQPGMLGGYAIKSPSDPFGSVRSPSAGYLAYNARLNEAARRLAELTGHPWTGAEVQESGWSWLDALQRRQGIMEEGAGEAVPTLSDAVPHVTQEDLLQAPDFATLFGEQGYAARPFTTTPSPNLPGLDLDALRRLAQNATLHGLGKFLRF